MRKLLTPISVVGIGLLAAMPFRKQTTPLESAVVAPNDSAVDLRSPAEVAGSEFILQSQNRLEGPRSVVPLREEPVREQPRWLIALEQQSKRSEPVPAAENPYDLVIRELPSSYEEIAIPLSPESHSGNLLVGEQQVDLLPDHFGIPREVSTVPALAPFGDDRTDLSANGPHGIAAQSAKFQPASMQEFSSETASSEPQESESKTTRQRHFIRVPRP